MQIFYLHSDHRTLVIGTDPAPRILYWGPRLKSEIPDNAALFDRGVPQARLDVDIPLALCPETGRGDFGSPGLEGSRFGQDWAPIFDSVDIEQTAQTLMLNLRDHKAALHLTIELTLDEKSDLLRYQMKLTNEGDSAYQLQRLALTVPLPAQFDELMSFHGRWSREFQSQRLNLQHGGYLQENRRGRTSHEYFPGMMVGRSDFSEQRGELYGVHLGCSGNHRMRVDMKSDGQRYLQAEELLLPGEIELLPRQSYATPVLYMVSSEQGLNGISQNFHHYLRHTLLAPLTNKPRPVHLNTWEGIYFDHNPEYICQMVSEAAELGVERFIIDDGWFKGRDGERAALGDWYLDEQKYPDGLEPIIAHVNALGMEFGLWVEPEMVNPDSDLFRSHPDWVLGDARYNQPTGRWQYVLDLQNPAVFGYLDQRLDAILTQYNIGYLKWDMNRELVQATHHCRAAVHGQTKALHRLMQGVRERFPDVEIESCSSGGGRIDYQMLNYCQRFWTSDCNDALERQEIQRGFSYFFPPEVMGAHIGAAQSHTTRRTQSMEYRGLTALMGHMGVELDPLKTEITEKQGFARQIALYKRLRSLLHSGRSFRLDMDDPNCSAYGVQNPECGVVVIAQHQMPEYAQAGRLCLERLQPDAHYRIELIEKPTATLLALMKRLPDWTLEPQTLSGEFLMQIGLVLPLLDPESALLIEYTRL